MQVKKGYGWIRPVATGVGIAAALFWLSGTDLMRAFELRTLDARFRLAGGRAPGSKAAIVFIGDDSIKAFGRWPWTWDNHALLVDILARAGARKIFFDIVFSEPPGAGEVRFLAGVTAAAGNVYFSSYFDEVKSAGEGRGTPPEGQGLHGPVPELARVGAGVGHINVLPDLDGAIRRLPLVVRSDGKNYPAVPLRLAADLLGAAVDDGQLPGFIVLKPRQGPALKIPLEPDGQTMINFIGGMEAFPAYSFHEVVQADSYPDKAPVDLAVFRDKVVFVGVTFAGSTDLRPTPFSKAYPMTAVQATVLDNIMSGRFIASPSRPLALALWLCLGVLSAMVAYSFRPLVSFILSFLVGTAWVGAAVGGFVLFRWNLDVVGPFWTVVTTYTGVATLRHFTVESHARQIRKMFSSYVTERVVNELIARPELAALGGQRREVTVLFADIRGFTPFAEKHRAEEVVAQLNEYLDAMTGVIIRWEGTLDKFIGDAIVAFWGAPLAQEDHAERALRCSLHMIRRLEELRERWRAEGKEPFEIALGLNSGEVIVGNIGSEGRKMDYTVIGDAVNLGSRLVPLNKKYGSRILITEFSLNRVRELVRSGRLGHLTIRGLEKVVVKGKQEPVEIYELRSEAPGAVAGISQAAADVSRMTDKDA